MFASLFAQAQDSTKTKKKSVIDKIKEVPEMLIAQPDQTDTLANQLRNNDLYLIVNPIWKQQGTQIGNDLKVPKINEDPLSETFPLSDKKIANGLNITMVTQKKLPEEKKQGVIAQVKTHLIALYKEAGKTQSGDEITTQVNSMISAPEAFTTNDGKTGELYLVNDFASQQSNFMIVFIAPGNKPGTSNFIQFNYYKYSYDAIPDDLNELKVFGFPDDQKEYVDFTKKVLKTLKVQ
jgi:hypothetical protein